MKSPPKTAIIISKVKPASRRVTCSHIGRICTGLLMKSIVCSTVTCSLYLIITAPAAKRVTGTVVQSSTMPSKRSPG